MVRRFKGVGVIFHGAACACSMQGEINCFQIKDG